MIQHIVLFTPKSDLPDERRQAFASLVLDTLSGSSDVERFSIGRRVSINAGYERNFGDKTYEYSAVIEFKTPECLISYLRSPEHARLGRLFWESCDSCVVSELEVISSSTPSYSTNRS